MLGRITHNSIKAWCFICGKIFKIHFISSVLVEFVQVFYFFLSLDEKTDFSTKVDFSMARMGARE